LYQKLMVVDLMWMNDQVIPNIYFY